MDVKEYSVTVGEKDVERLKLQHETFAQGTENFIKNLGIKEGDKVLVIGSGGGDESLLFSRLVGARGKILGIDISAEQVRVASARAKEEKISNVEFQTLNVSVLDSLGESFDFVYCRMVLTHLAGVENVLKKMFSKVKEGGILACEEPEVSSCKTFPPSHAFEEHINLLCQLIKRKGGDPDIGPKLYQIFRSLNPDSVGISFSQPAVTDARLKKAAFLSVYSCGPGYIAEGLTTAEDVTRIAEGIRTQVVECKDVFMMQCRMAQLWVKKSV